MLGPEVMFDSWVARRVKSSLVSTLQDSRLSLDQRAKDRDVLLAVGSAKGDHSVTIASGEITKCNSTAKDVGSRLRVERRHLLPKSWRASNTSAD